jgi:hypothetical protein
MVAGRGRLPAAALRGRQLGGSPSLATFTGRLGGVPAAPKISAQDEATILARHDAGEPLRVIAADYPLSHQALSKARESSRMRANADGGGGRGRPGLVDGPRTRPAFLRLVASLLVWQARFAGSV